MTANNDGLKDEIFRKFDAGSYREYYAQELGELGKLNTSGWVRALCPFHDDTNPSLDVNFFREGAYNCHACGAKGDIFTFHQRKHGGDFKEALQYFANFLGINPTKKYKKAKLKFDYDNPDEVYHYIDLNGKIVHETLRFSKPIKKFSQRRPDPAKKGKYIYTLKGIEVIPYNLKEFVNADQVLFVEGEKDVQSLQKIGLIATTNPMGSEKWFDSLTPYFKDKSIILLPDNDEPGRNHAKLVSNHLYNVAKSIKIINLPGLKEGGDVTDWLKTGNKETLVALIKAQRPYQNHIDWLNERHAAIMMSGKFMIMNHEIHPITDNPHVSFSGHNDFLQRYLNRKIPNPKAGQKGQSKEISIATDWLKSPYRQEYDGIVFDPNKNKNGFYNLWTGFAFEPKQGDWSLFRQHIKDGIANGQENYFKWLMTWMARIIQDPGGKRPGTSIVLRGEQGTGKGVFASCFGQLVGKHYLQINNQDHLTGRFNAHLQNVLLLFVDEGFWAGDKSSEGILKGLITEEALSIEAKGRDTFSIRNNINLVMASNNNWVVPSGLFERRFCVLDVSSKYKQNYEHFQAIVNQLQNGGYEAMLYDLLRWDLKTADIKIIPRTNALMDQIVESMDPVQLFWFEHLREGLLDPLNDGCDDWFELDSIEVSTKNLRKQYLDFCDERGTRIKASDSAFGKQLKKLCPHVDRVRGTEHIERDGKRVRPWIYKFPRLHICRDDFEQKMGGIDYVWGRDLVFINDGFE